MKKFLLSILLIIILLSTNAKASNRVSNLIEPVKYFTNHRLQLDELRNKLSLYQKACLLGISGMGKTQLARKFAHQMKDMYEIIWFFNCGVDLNEQFAELAKHINNNYGSDLLDKKLSEELNESKKEVLEFLAPKKNWLLVFDNLLINQNDKLKDIFNWDNNGHIIVCSQDAQNLQEVIQLPHLTKYDSINLVSTIMSGPDTNIAEELAQEYKGYPIMVAQGAIFLENNKHMNVNEYKQILSKSTNKTTAHISHILKQLTPSAYDLLYKAALLNNQSFSKNLLSSLTKFPKNFAEDLYSITTRFGLITTIEDSDNNPIFEMHDTIKNAILKIGGKKLSKEQTTEIIDTITNLIKPGMPIADNNLSGNLQKILDNAEIYSVDIIEIMKIRKALFTYYMNNLRNYYNCQKMVDWFVEKEKKNSFNLWLMKDSEKAIYADYLINIATFHDFAKSDYLGAVEYFDKAIKILEKIPDYQTLKFEVYGMLAQTQIYSGDITNTKKNLMKVEKLVYDNPNIKFDDLGLYYFIIARVALCEGRYEDALKSIKESAKAYSSLPEDGLYLSCVHILEAEILNYMGRYQEAKTIALIVYENLKNSIKEDHEIHARTLRQLSMAECGLHQFEAALQHAEIAKEIYINDKHRKNKNLATSQDVDLADVLVVEANCLSELNYIKEALESYTMAETIYYNVYRENMKNFDSISLLYYMAAKTASQLDDKTYYKRLHDLHLKMFGPNHKRSIKINEMVYDYSRIILALHIVNLIEFT